MLYLEKRDDITERLLKVALYTIKPTNHSIHLEKTKQMKQWQIRCLPHDGSYPLKP
jgi:hypothetical protein